MGTKNQSSKKTLTSLFVILFLLTTPLISSAQFTYIGVTTGFNNNLIGPSSGLGNADSRTMNYGLRINVKAAYRPIRNIGVGAEFSYPLVQGTANKSYDFDNILEPNDFKYRVKQKFNFTAIASLFADTDANFHVDFRFSYFSFEEKFKFDRYGFIDTYKEKTNAPAAGFALGFMPHLSRHLFFDINLGFDFLLFGSDPEFSYSVDYDLNSGQGFKYTTLESQLSGVKPSFFMNIGLGYFF